MPRRRAALFISSENFSTEPEMPSAVTTAMSFADFTIIIFSALSSVTWVPALKPILAGGSAAARADTVNSVSRGHAPLAHRLQRYIERH